MSFTGFTIRVPATIANLGPGFDSFGMAVSLHNQFTVEPAEHDRLSGDPASSVDISPLNDATGPSILFAAMDRVFEQVGQTRPHACHVQVTARIPIARGLGSSSTAVAAGLVAANHLLQDPLNADQLLDLGIALEGHPDNIAPALLGGTVLYDTRPYSLPWPSDWGIITLSPSYPILTEAARRIMPQHVSLADSVFNLRKSAVLTYALLRHDADALREALADRLHQPYRKQLIPEFDHLAETARRHGAYGTIISGSGSTMAIFCSQTQLTSLHPHLQAELDRQQWPMIMHRLHAEPTGATLMNA